jgi:hypothetical protein
MWKEKVQKEKLRSTTHTHTYIMTHILFYILWHMSYDAKYMTYLTLQNAYTFITQSYLMLYIIWHMIYAIYYMTHVLCYILTFDIFKLFIYEVDCDTCNSYKWINSELVFNERTPSSGKVKLKENN